jgi:hypothetical protein
MCGICFKGHGGEMGVASNWQEEEGLKVKKNKSGWKWKRWHHIIREGRKPAAIVNLTNSRQMFAKEGHWADKMGSSPTVFATKLRLGQLKIAYRTKTTKNSPPPATFKMTSRNLIGIPVHTRQGNLKITFRLISMRIARDLTTNTSAESSECTESLHSNIRRLIFLSHFTGLYAICNFQLAQP